MLTVDPPAAPEAGSAVWARRDPMPRHQSSCIGSLTPVAGDRVVLKRRVSAFAGSDLEVVLRAGRVRTRVLAGIDTGGVVLSTIRAAAERDFHLDVLDDACADQDSKATVAPSMLPMRRLGWTALAMVAAIGATESRSEPVTIAQANFLRSVVEDWSTSNYVAHVACS